MTEEIKFEKALERLEKIVEDLEAGNIPLDEALKKYEEGVKLSRACQERLNQAEKKIEILTRTLNSTLKKEPFLPSEKEEGDAGDGSPRKRTRRTASGEEPNKGDLLF